MMTIRTIKDARALINQIELFLLIKGVIRARINLGSVDISRYNDELWIGHYGNNLMKLCPTYDDIVDFAYNHHRISNPLISSDIDWEQIGEVLREISEDGNSDK